MGETLTPQTPDHACLRLWLRTVSDDISWFRPEKKFCFLIPIFLQFLCSATNNINTLNLVNQVVILFYPIIATRWTSMIVICLLCLSNILQYLAKQLRLVKDPYWWERWRFCSNFRGEKPPQFGCPREASKVLVGFSWFLMLVSRPSAIVMILMQVTVRFTEQNVKIPETHVTCLTSWQAAASLRLCVSECKLLTLSWTDPTQINR